jgi:AraC family transcriptional activator of pobA
MVKAILHLLMQPNLSLEEIADRLNFSSVSYLSRYVKNKIGITPSEYRESVRHR